MYPLRFVPVYKHVLWQGNTLSAFRPDLSSGCGESWEVCDSKEGISLIASGPLKGVTLRELVETKREELLGKNRSFLRFPLLVKIIDAKEPLSLQVHPFSGDEAKSEGWYFLEENPSFVWAGWKKRCDEHLFKNKLEEGKVESLLQKIRVGKGDFIFLPGGVVHAIGGGNFLLEVQNNSHCTYRIYDWERRDLEGNKRPLQIKKALHAIAFEETPLFVSHKKQPLFLRQKIFDFEEIFFYNHYRKKVDPGSFLLFFFVKGEGRISTPKGGELFSSMTTFLIAASSQEVLIEATGFVHAIKISLPP